jgi:HAD superfamily hydrolase (TIGR01509 family)
MMHFKGAIFDLDGTLFDSMPIWEHVAFDYLESLGITPNSDVREAVQDMSIQQACEYFCNVYGLKLSREEIADGVNRLIEDFYFHRAPLKDGVMEMLQTLKDRGIRMCVATATDRYLVETAMKRTGILPFFEAVFTCTEAGCGKDKPDIFLKALQNLGTDLKDTVVFEDALYAIRTAKSAGFTVIALYDEAAKAHREQIQKLADLCFKSFTEWNDCSA